MRKFAILLALGAWVGHGRRVQSAETLAAVARMRSGSSDIADTADSDSLNSFAALLAALHPKAGTAAFNPNAGMPALDVRRRAVTAAQHPERRFAPVMSISDDAAFDNKLGVQRRALLAGTLASVWGFSQAASAASLRPGEVPKFDMKIKEYKELKCPPALAAGRAGGSEGAGANAAGFAQKCVNVQASLDNPYGKEYDDVAVFGRVFSVDDTMSVLGNGQDGKNDAGQFATIDKVTKGPQDLNFIFVAQQPTACKPEPFKPCPKEGVEPLVKLRFEQVKAIAYPKTGAKQFKDIDECEGNEFAEGCDGL